MTNTKGLIRNPGESVVHSNEPAVANAQATFSSVSSSVIKVSFGVSDDGQNWLNVGSQSTRKKFVFPMSPSKYRRVIAASDFAGIADVTITTPEA